MPSRRRCPLVRRPDKGGFTIFPCSTHSISTTWTLADWLMWHGFPQLLFMMDSYQNQVAAPAICLLHWCTGNAHMCRAGQSSPHDQSFVWDRTSGAHAHNTRSCMDQGAIGGGLGRPPVSAKWQPVRAPSPGNSGQVGEWLDSGPSWWESRAQFDTYPARCRRPSRDWSRYVSCCKNNRRHLSTAASLIHTWKVPLCSEFSWHPISSENAVMCACCA